VDDAPRQANGGSKFVGQVHRIRVAGQVDKSANNLLSNLNLEGAAISNAEISYVRADLRRHARPIP
jgi:hypothetical protein